MKTQLRSADEELRLRAQSPTPNKAQHSPLPWKVAGDLDGVREDYREDRCLITEDFDYDERTGSIIAVLRGHGPELRANARFVLRAVNNADKLAEALRFVLKYDGHKIGSVTEGTCKAALAAYEAAQ